MKKLKMPIVSQEEFYKILVAHLVNDRKDWTTENHVESLLMDGFPKLEWKCLGDSLYKMFVYLPTMAVEFGDAQFIWVVSGNKAMLVEKKSR